MLAEVFRASPERVGRIRELLNDPTLAAAIVTLKDEATIDDVPISSDPVESVRRLSWLCGYDAAVNLLLTLAEPLPVPEVEEQPFEYLAKK